MCRYNVKDIALGSVIHKYIYYPDMCYKTFETVYSNYVASVLDYGSGIWGFKSFNMKVYSIEHKWYFLEYIGLHHR